MNKQELYSDIKILIDNFCENYKENFHENFSQPEINNFLDLINNYTVTIPIIQRDYAQGRTDKNASYIRGEFLNDIKEVLEGKSSSLHLDYIYGNINENKFEPLDGQQRLTTLFLICLYLYKNNHKDAGFLKNKFTYQTRISAKEFFENLVDKLEIPESKDFSENIKDSEWFINQWLQDPTVSGCLKMLEDIHEKFYNIKDTDNNTYTDNITNITFNLLDMGKLDLYDDLYIKMNSRGKALTDFENLKAQIIQYINNKEDNFSNSIDNEWSKFLWEKIKNKNKESENTKYSKDAIDNMHVKLIIMAIIITLSDFSIDNKLSDKEFSNYLKIIIDAIPKEKNNQSTGKIVFDLFKSKKFRELFKDILKENDKFDKDFDEYKKNHLIKNIKNIYDLIKDYDKQVTDILEKNNINYNGKKLTNITDLILFDEFSYSNCTMFLGQLFYLQSTNEILNEKDFASWIRFLRNLTNLQYMPKHQRQGKINADRFLRDERFLTPYKTIKEINGSFEKYIKNIKVNDSNDDDEKENNSRLQNFLSHEKEKFDFIKNNEDKKEALYTLENNTLFRGNLEFIFEGGYKDTIDLNSFAKAVDKCFKQELNDDFRFAFLAVYNDAYDFGENRHNCYTYSDDSSTVTKYRLYEYYSDIQWCLSNQNENDKIKDGLKKLFKEITNKSDSDNPLREIISKYCKTEQVKDSWQYIFINMYNDNKLEEHVPYIVMYRPAENQSPTSVSYLRIKQPRDSVKDFYRIYPDENE